MTPHVDPHKHRHQEHPQRIAETIEKIAEAGIIVMRNKKGVSSKDETPSL